MKNVNIGALLTNRAYLSPTLEGYIGQKCYSFLQMNERANQFSVYLDNIGMKSGKRMALLCKNHEDFITAFFGAAKRGIITIPINWRLKEKEISYILNHCEPSLFIYDPEFSDVVQGVEYNQSNFHQIQSGMELSTLIEHLPTEEPMVQTKDDDPILIMYTSGTTGHPKGAMISHGNLLAASIGMSHVIDWWYGDRFLSVAPFFHIGGFAPIITNVHNGCTSILVKDFDPTSIWNVIEEEKITTMMTVPAMLQFMLQTLDKEKNDYSSIRNITCGGSMVPASLISAYQSMGLSIQQVYGITEYSGAVSFWKSSMDESKIQSMGKTVFHGQLEVVDPITGENLNAGEVGEIICSGPQVFKGYWRDEEATQAVLKNSVYHSGDLGKIDSDGFIYVIDRLKDMIISGGENIYSSEVEMVIQQHPEILEVAVVGVPDAKWGEISKAFVVKKAGSSLIEEDIIQLCREQLAAYKSVKLVEFIEQLPRNAVGKVLKTALKS